MLTFQDFERAQDKVAFILNAIRDHESTKEYKLAMDAEKYDLEQNVTINEYVQKIWTMTGSPVVDFTASNAKVTSNFFHRLNTQRKTYLLGNGVTFKNDSTKKALGKDFDTVLGRISYKALIHGRSFGFWNYDRLHLFSLLEFVPLLDEETSALRAGIRYWKISDDKPMFIVLYEEDGYTKYKAQDKYSNKPGVEVIQPKQAYIRQYIYTEADGETLIGEQNYGRLPIIPMWGSQKHQSTLIGMRSKIDSYDLIRSGFANDLQDVAQIYWLIENAGGMDDDDLNEFRERLKFMHIAVANTQDGTKATPYTQDIPHEAREAYLQGIKTQLYEDFGALDVHQVSADSTNDHLEAAYQPLDEEADDFEAQVTEFIDQLLKLVGIDDYPTYKRNRISNQKEQTEMVLSANEYLDEETVLNHLPWITVDEIADILKRKDAEDMERFGTRNPTGDDDDLEDEETPTENNKGAQRS